MSLNKIASDKRLLPAYPLLVKDPFFSIWSTTDKLNESDTEFWNGLKRRVYGLVSADGKTYCFMGKVDGAENMTQTSGSLTAFTTDYTFVSPDFDLNVSFVSPLTPDNLELLGCPVCYVNYDLIPKKKLNKVSVSLFVGEEICYDRERMTVRGGVHSLPMGECAWMGLKKQLIMSQAFDSSAAEWGYWYLVGQNSFLTSREAVDKYVKGGDLEFIITPDCDKFLASENAYYNIDSKTSGKFMLAFDDLVSIFYFGDFLRGYWFEDGKDIFDALVYSEENRGKILEELNKFDADLKKCAEKYGEDYLLILYAGLRQSVGAHKLVKNKKGEVLFLSKECHSNGCIATADVSYPSTPLYLLYNPELVKGMLRPIFEFNDKEVWKFDFAPHDAGTYPWCMGNVYGSAGDNKKQVVDGGNWDKKGDGYIPCNYPITYNLRFGADIFAEKNQMPVEECGNMLIMTAAALVADGDKSLASENFDALTKWVKYLVEFGLKPGNQLCTDDFTGHLDQNVNLSVKAIVGIMAYSIICDKLGKRDEAEKYEKTAREYAAEWKKTCFTKGKPTPLTFDSADGTFSLKYNILFDVLFGTNLFGSDVRESETDYYIEKAEKYGIALDNRAEFTKTDWVLWAAALSDSVEKRRKILAPLAKFLRETPQRIPFSDWTFVTDAKTGWWYTDKAAGGICCFRNRTVQGGLFSLLLADSGKLKIK